MRVLRSTAFVIQAALWTLFAAPIQIAGALLLRGKWGYHLGKFWRLGIQWGVVHLLGIRPNFVGLENMPKEACVILSKHQSAWETLFLQDCVPPGAYCVFVLKKELLRVPFIGWGLGAMKMISIDRAAGKNALDQVVTQGRERLKQGFYVIIFPEGTSVAPGQKKRYKPGGAYLAPSMALITASASMGPVNRSSSTGGWMTSASRPQNREIFSATFRLIPRP